MTDDFSTTFAETIEYVKEAFKGWHSPSLGISPLTQLKLFQQFYANSGSAEHSVQQMLLDCLAELDDERVAKVLRTRFVDGLSVLEVANQMCVTEGAIARWQQSGYRELAMTLLDKEMALE